MLGRTVTAAAAATGTFFMFYVVMTYMPTIFTDLHVALTTALGFAALVTAAAIPGKMLNGWLSERWGRKPLFAVFMILAAVTAVLFTTTRSPGTMLLTAMGMSFFGTGAFPGLKMFYAEQYPTRYRVTGAATVEAVARTLGGIVGAAFMPLAWHVYGLSTAFWIIGTVAAASAIVMLVWAHETRGLTLEAIEATYRPTEEPPAQPA
jgi:putative MFS transporter